MRCTLFLLMRGYGMEGAMQAAYKANFHDKAKYQIKCETGNSVKCKDFCDAHKPDVSSTKATLEDFVDSWLAGCDYKLVTVTSLSSRADYELKQSSIESSGSNITHNLSWDFTSGMVTGKGGVIGFGGIVTAAEINLSVAVPTGRNPNDEIPIPKGTVTIAETNVFDGLCASIDSRNTFPINATVTVYPNVYNWTDVYDVKEDPAYTGTLDPTKPQKPLDLMVFSIELDGLNDTYFEGWNAKLADITSSLAASDGALLEYSPHQSFCVGVSLQALNNGQKPLFHKHYIRSARLTLTTVNAHELSIDANGLSEISPLIPACPYKCDCGEPIYRHDTFFGAAQEDKGVEYATGMRCTLDPYTCPGKLVNGDLYKYYPGSLSYWRQLLSLS